MRRQTLIAISVAVGLGLMAVYLVNTYLGAKGASQEQGELVKVAVASVPLNYGTEVTPDTIRFAAMPRSSLPPGSYTAPEQLFGDGEKRVALMPIAVNEPILPGKISGAGQNASISALLPAGMRAASVRINDVSGVAGFVQPNDSVDVLVTRQFQVGSGPGARNQQITDVLLQDARVLALDQRARSADGKPTVARSATLQVDPIGAQKLALAQEIGSLSLVLRKPGEAEDTAVVQTVSLNDLRYGVTGPPPRSDATAAAPARAWSPPAAQRPTPRPQPAKAPAPRRDTMSVEVVRGTTNNSYEVGG
jgi:pilus assembly protein CpaB